MMIERLFKPLRIGKSLLSLLAMFVMLLAPQGAWATVYSTTSSYTEETSEGYVKYYWNLNDDWKFEVRSDNYYTSTVSLASNPFGFTFTSDGGQICGLLGNGSEKITKVVLSGIDSNEKVTVTLKNKSDYSESIFLASTTAGEFYLPESETWNANGELYIDIDKACTITGVTIYTGTNDDGVIAWPDGPSYDNTTNENDKQLNGAIVINKNDCTNYDYKLSVGSTATVSYSSSDESVATVENSSVTIKKIGQTTIIAKVVDGGNYLNFSYQLVAVDGAYCGLIVAGEYVTANNASNITGDYIEGSTGTLSYVDDTNTGTLTLKGVTITGNIIRTNNKGLTVYLDGNSTITFTPGNGARIFMGNNTEYPLLFSTNESNPGSLHIGGTGNINEFSSGWGDGSTRIWNKECGAIHASEYSWWVNPDCYQMDLYANKNYDLWIDNAQFCTALLSHFGGVEFKPSTSTLELRERTSNDYDYEFTPHSFTSKLSALTVTVKGEVTMKAFQFVSTDGVTSGTLTISNKDNEKANTLNLTNIKNSGSVIADFNSVTIDEGLTVDYAIKVGTTNVTNNNANNVLGGDVATVLYDYETNTLKLNNAVLGNSAATSDIVVSNLGILNLEIKGTNIIEGSIIGDGQKLNIVKAANAESPTLTVASSNPVYAFSDVTLGKDLFLNPYFGENGDYELVPGVYYSDKYQLPVGNTPTRVVYSTEKETGTLTTSIWVGGKQVSDGIFVGYDNVLFNYETNTLTLSGANLGSKGNQSTNIQNVDIVSSYPTLTIQLAGNNSVIGKIVSLDPEATLTFTTTDNAGSLDIKSETPISGFKGVPTFNNDLTFLSNDNSARIMQLIAPVISPDGSEIYLNSDILIDDDNNELTSATLKYSIQYPGQTSTEYVYNDKAISMDKPGTLEAYVVNTDVYGNTKTSAHAVAKYLGYADKTITLDEQTLNSELDVSEFEVVPEIATTDGITFSIAGSDNPDVIEFNAENGKAYVRGVGVCNLEVNYLCGDTEPSYQILNEVLNAKVTVFPEFHNHWVTFYNGSQNAIELTEGVGAFVITSINQTATEATATQISNIPAGVVVLLNDETTEVSEAVYNTDVTGNYLQHATNAVEVNAEEGDYYGLYNGAFIRITDKSTIPAGKNYLLNPFGMTNGPEAPQLTIVIEGETTGIDDVRNKMEDVRGDVYDLMGRKVQKPSKKGLYISKGHKVVINK